MLQHEHYYHQVIGPRVGLNYGTTSPMASCDQTLGAVIGLKKLMMVVAGGHYGNMVLSNIGYEVDRGKHRPPHTHM